MSIHLCLPTYPHTHPHVYTHTHPLHTHSRNRDAPKEVPCFFPGSSSGRTQGFWLWWGGSSASGSDIPAPQFSMGAAGRDRARRVQGLVHPSVCASHSSPGPHVCHSLERLERLERWKDGRDRDRGETEMGEMQKRERWRNRRDRDNGEQRHGRDRDRRDGRNRWERQRDGEERQRDGRYGEMGETDLGKTEIWERQRDGGSPSTAGQGSHLGPPLPATWAQPGGLPLVGYNLTALKPLGEALDVRLASALQPVPATRRLKRLLSCLKLLSGL